MTLNLFVIAAIAALFYVVIPGIGAFRVRRRWRRFRFQITQTARRPTLRYGEFQRAADGFIGHYRFVGSLEAIQGRDTIWIHDDTMSASADLGDSSVLVLPSEPRVPGQGVEERLEASMEDEMPQELPWSKISTLTEGSRLVVSGPLYSYRGHPVFRPRRGDPLTVVLFDGEERSILRRSIWAFRQQNEYWNQSTPISLLGGSIVLFVVAYYFSQMPLLRITSLFALWIGISPLMPLLPPGVVLFFLYRTLWRAGRVRRAERDLLKLPADYFEENNTSAQTELPSGEIYAMDVTDSLESAVQMAPNASVRRASVLRHETPDRYFVFGAPRDETDGVTYDQPKDPMAEHLIIPGDPWRLIRRSNASARMFEVLSVLSFAGAFAVNWFLGFAALLAWIR